MFTEVCKHGPVENCSDTPLRVDRDIEITSQVSGQKFTQSFQSVHVGITITRGTDENFEVVLFANSYSYYYRVSEARAHARVARTPGKPFLESER